MKKIIGTITAFLLAFSFMCSNNASASTIDIDTRVEQEYNQNGSKLKEIVIYEYDENGTVLDKKVITDEKEIKDQLRKEIINNEKQIKQQNKDIINQTKEQSFENYNSNESVSPMAWGDLRVIKGWTGSYSSHLKNTSGGPGGTVNASVNQSFSTTLSSTTTVSSSIISRAIGVTVQSSISVSEGYSHEIPSGKYGYISTYINYSTIYFDIEKEGLFGGWSNVGEGSYTYATGATFRYYDS